MIVGTGRSAIQRINRYEDLVRLLDDSGSAEVVKDALANTITQDFLKLLSAEQWEVLCSEYLRDKIGLRLLLLAEGKVASEVAVGATAVLELAGADKATT